MSSYEPVAWDERRTALGALLPRVTIEWAARRDELGDTQLIDGSMLFVDISGFTRMSERLAKFGRLGAEEVTDAVETCFRALLALAYNAGGSLLKFGGDALLILFRGDVHAMRAATTAIAMQERLRHVGRIATSAGTVRLRMSAGVHTGTFGCFLVGGSHHELILAGPDVSTVVAMEGTARAGEVVVSPATAAAIDARLIGPPQGDGLRLRRVQVRVPDDPAPRGVPPDLDLRSYLPAPIVAHVEAGGGQPAHRTVGIAFCHFDGTDALMRDDGPGAVAAALDGLVTVVQEEVDRSGVLFLATDVDEDGGKVILASGIPTATEADADALLATVRRIADRDLPLPLRIGVHRGAVFAGEVGPPYRRTYTVMGDAVNLAARLMARADPGRIVASPEILAPSRTSFATTPLEPFMVKGKRRPVEASELGAPRRLTARAAVALPFVGREPVCAGLAAAVADVRGGGGVAVEITGPAGIGKSRLTDELRSLATGLPVLTVACNPYEASTPYAVFWWLLHDVLDLGPEAARDDVRDALVGAMERHAPDLAPWLPLLGTVLDVDLPATPEISAIDPQYLPNRVREVVATFLNAVLPAHVVVIVEDAHWMDDASSEVLELIVRAVHTRSALVCVTRRDQDGGAQIGELAHTTTFRLEPLTAAEVVATLTAATDDVPLRADELDALATRAAGNPLFLATLLDARRAGEDVRTLPTTIDDLVTAQIDRLPPELRDVVRVASVLGQTFPLHDLELLLGRPVPADPTREWAGLDGLLEPGATGTLRFRHALVRDAAYAELPFRRRRELHARAGDAIAAPLGDHPETEAEILSLHYFHARRYDDAWRFACVAAQRAATKYANVEAIELLQRAVDSARHGADVSGSDLAAVWEELGDVAERGGFFDRALAAYRTARRLRQDDPVATAGILLKEAWIAERTGRYVEAVRAVRRGLRLVADDPSVDAARVRTRLRGWYALVRHVQGRSREAQQECEAVIGLAAALGDRATEAHARSVLDWILVERGDRPEGHAQRALELFTEIGDLSGQASVLNNLGAFAYFDGRWPDAVELYDRARVLRERTGNSVEAAIGTLNIGEILIDQGRLAEASIAVSEADRIWRAAGDRSAVAYAQMQLARIAALRGDFASAFERLATARQTLTDVGADADVVEVDLRTAECRILAGDLAGAEELATATLDRDRSAGGVIDHAPLLRIIALARLGRGDVTGARALATECLDEARRRESPFDTGRALEVLADVEAAAGNDDLAADRAAEAGGYLDRLGVVRI